MDEIRNRIKKAMELRDYTQADLVRLSGIDKGQLSSYLSGRYKPKQDNIFLLSKVLNVNEAWLLGYDVPMEKSSSYVDSAPSFKDVSPIKKHYFPMLGSIACGQPIVANEVFESYVMTDMDVSADFCLTARGDSMINARIFDGDVVFIRKQDTVQNGEIAAVAIDDEVTLKRVFYYPEEQSIRLQAENPQYAPKTYSGEQLDHIHILGKAVFFQSIVR